MCWPEPTPWLTFDNTPPLPQRLPAGRREHAPALWDQVPDTATAAPAESVNGRMRKVVQDRQVDDSAHLGTVGADDGPPELTTEEGHLIGTHGPILNAVTSSRAVAKVPQHD
jgi:hypothetical protein